VKLISYRILFIIFCCNIHSLNYASCFDFDKEPNNRAYRRREFFKEEYQLTTEESRELDSFLYNLNKNQYSNNFLEESVLLIKIKPKNNLSKFSIFSRAERLRIALSYNIRERVELRELHDSEEIDDNIWSTQELILRKTGNRICKEIKEICNLKAFDIQNRKRRSDCCDEDNKKLKNDEEALI